MEESIKDLTMAAFDRFSDMPVHIVHHIMSFLPITSATRVSALSKNFNSAWLSYPVFDFDQALYEKVIRHSGYWTSFKKPDFLDFVLDSLMKHCPSDIYMQRFSLRAWPLEISYNRVQNSIRLAVDRNVNELVVEIVEIQGLRLTNFCPLPRTALQNTKSLRVLKLSGFSLDLEDLIPCLNLVEDLTLDCCSVSGSSMFSRAKRNFMFSSAKLKDLKLRFCRELGKIEIDALNLQSFSYTACHIEQRSCEINLSCCKKLKSLTIEESNITDDWVEDHVSKLVLLRNLKLVACKNLQKFEIVALNLQTFSYTAYDHREQHPCEFNLSYCKNLKSLTIEKSNITDDWVKDHVSKLVLLRNLKLVACKNLQKIKISNRQLESFELLQCEKLLKAKIEAPNLISFDYSGDALYPNFPNIILSSTLANVKLSLVTTEYQRVSFLDLSTFLTRFGHCKTLSLSLGTYQALSVTQKLSEYLVHPVLLDLRHMRVELWSLCLSSSLTGLLDGFLWLAPNLETLFISVQRKSLMLHLEFYKWGPRGEDHIIKKVTIVKYEGRDDDKKSLLNYFHEKAITVEANSDC
ncbi:hypothetical protein FH972_014267 [Carpinus fangiana]|uniref:F-box domain-containing protein n=1 Tax=Carpinus fangiana TaxID=176857 RepID=A0A5N6R9B9_9ROSI|nr:hypothetical protein FH972_014267 [Carpinus fangiana]